MSEREEQESSVEIMNPSKSDVTFLKDYYIDNQEYMRYLIDSEYKLLNIFLIVYPFSITALATINNIVLNNITNKGILFMFSFLVIFFLLALTWFVTKKMRSNHRKYERIGQINVKIWEFFQLFKKGSYLQNNIILDRYSKDYGKGSGYKQTIRTLWIMTLLTAVILILVGIVSAYWI